MTRRREASTGLGGLVTELVASIAVALQYSGVSVGTSFAGMNPVSLMPSGCVPLNRSST